MFRQVVMCTWAEGVTPEAKQGLRESLESLREIPELLDMRWGEDAGHFEGNHDWVMVADFADFESARRYVAHPLHQAYVQDHASKVVGDRVIVQHDWQDPTS